MHSGWRPGELQRDESDEAAISWSTRETAAQTFFYQAERPERRHRPRFLAPAATRGWRPVPRAQTPSQADPLVGPLDEAGQVGHDE